MLAIEGFVLTGGASSRMGTEKARLDLGGETFAERAVRILSNVCVEVSTVGGDAVDHVPRIEDADALRRADGNAAIIGVYSALDHSGSEWSAILACDLPFVTVDLLRLLILKAGVAKAAAAVVPLQPDRRPQPLCGLYRTKRCFRAVKSAINRGKLSLMELLDDVETVLVGFPEYRHLEDADELLLNINTPHDLQKARRIVTKTN